MILNPYRIRERLGMITFPEEVNPVSFDDKVFLKKLGFTTVPDKINPMPFDNDVLVEKCKLWYSVQDSMAYSIRSTIVKVVQPGFFELVIASFNEEIDDSMGFISSGGSELESKCEMLYIHAFSKFTTEEFLTLVKPSSSERLQEIANLHIQIKELDWFWNNGIYCFDKGVENVCYIGYFNGRAEEFKITLSEKTSEVKE